MPIPKSHHPLPPDLGLEYRFVDIPLKGEFPISGVWMHELEPQSQPISYLHMHRSLEIGYCFEGTGIVMVEDRLMSFHAGDVTIINSSEMHMARRADGIRNHWGFFWLDPAALLAGMSEGLEISDQSVFGGHGFENVISPKDHPEICQIVRWMIDELQRRSSPPPGHRAVLRGLAAMLMAHLHRMLQSRPRTGEAVRRPGVERVAPTLRHIANHYTEPIDAEELAGLCGLSVTHFYRVFLAAVGVSPQQYLSRLRVRMAAGMLREQSNRSIISIASAVGFDSINTFNRQFRKTLGAAPRDWRRRSATAQPVP